MYRLSLFQKIIDVFLKIFILFLITIKKGNIFIPPRKEMKGLFPSDKSAILVSKCYKSLFVEK
jgi:hypothetical protein